MYLDTAIIIKTLLLEAHAVCVHGMSMGLQALIESLGGSCSIRDWTVAWYQKEHHKEDLVRVDWWLSNYGKQLPVPGNVGL